MRAAGLQMHITPSERIDWPEWGTVW